MAEKKHAILVWLVLQILLFSGCATYHQQHLPFHNAIAASDYDKAVDYLETKSNLAKGKNKLLYYLELGSAYHLAGNYSASNDAFEEAYIILEEFARNYALDALSFITNPAVVPYPGEDFEKVQLHYYKALNFALQGNYNDAIVECRRINVKLNILNDRYEAGKKNRYHNDAFAWYFMGMLFDATRDFNNAFICYRNALDCYQSDYLNDYNLSVPHQLKTDLLQAARRTGLKDELAFYQNQFQIDLTETKSNRSSGELIVFWNNGLGPVKTEDSLNFFLDGGKTGIMTFTSDDQSMILPVPTGGRNHSSLGDVSVIRMALPRYSIRSPRFTQAEVMVNSEASHLSPVQNINGIALINLEDRMGRELGTALLRVALKKAIEEVVRKEDEGLGVAVSVLNAVTERADTRNWQTLPHTIYCSRLQLPPGEHNVVFTAHDNLGNVFETNNSVRIESEKIQFLVISNPQTIQ